MTENKTTNPITEMFEDDGVLSTVETVDVDEGTCVKCGGDLADCMGAAVRVEYEYDGEADPDGLLCTACGGATAIRDSHRKNGSFADRLEDELVELSAE